MIHPSAEFEQGHEPNHDSINPIEEEDGDYDQPLSLPYGDGCFQKLKYRINTFLIIHPRLYALYLLCIETWPRAVLFVDIYTDIVVAYELYLSFDRIWFFCSGLFILLPFVLVWSASLRFIQAKLNTLFKKTNNSVWIHGAVNVFLFFYMFPLIGAVFMCVFEIYWVISDIFNALKAFVFGTGLIDAEDREQKAMKSYRRAVAVFAESVPQAVLQLYIFIRLDGLTQISNGRVPINNALYVSFFVSVVNLCYNGYKFKSEAQLHGLTWSEYALSILQLAEIPTIKLVPRLPAIKKGYIGEVNFGGFKFDKQSITPLLEAITSAKCRLKRIKISIGSLSKLDVGSCKLLGSLLQSTGITVLLSRSSSLVEIKRLFESIDKKNARYLEQKEFISAIKTLNCSIKTLPLKKKQRIFKQLAIRRLKQRDRVYFYDFFKTAASIEDSKIHFDSEYEFDLTQIDFPVHFIFQRIHQIISSESSKKDMRLQGRKLVKGFNQLYAFCEGYGYLDQIETTLQNHVFFSVVDVMIELAAQKNQKQNLRYKIFVYQMFDKLAKSNSLNDQFYLKRNELFRQADNHKQFVMDNYGSDFSKYLQSQRNINGCNIFEYCFLFQTKPYQCKIFTRLLDVWLGKVNDNIHHDSESKEKYLMDLLTIKAEKAGELYYLFQYTQGFHIKDSHGETPLSYAAKYGLNNVIQFYVNYAMKILLRNGCPWIREQPYLHSILHNLINTETAKPSVDSLKLFLSEAMVNLQYLHNGISVGQYIVMYRHKSKSKDYILKCLETLKIYNYNFVSAVDIHGNNALHYTASLDDAEAARIIIDSLSEQKQSLETLLNTKNEHGYSPLSSAIRKDGASVVSLLLCYAHLITDLSYDFFVDKFKPIGKEENREKQHKWISCFCRLILNSDGFLNQLNEDLQQNISEQINRIYLETKKRKRHKNNRNQELIKHLEKIREEMDFNTDVVEDMPLPIKKKKKHSYRDSMNSLKMLLSFNDSFNDGDHIIYDRSVDKSEIIQEGKVNEQSPLSMDENCSSQLDISWQDYYYKAIKQPNGSCIGFKFVSPMDAATRWCKLDFVHLCALLASFTAMYVLNNKENREFDIFPLYVYNQYLNRTWFHILLFFILIIGLLLDFSTMFGIMSGNQTLVVLKLISLLLINTVLIMGYGIIEMVFAIAENKEFNNLHLASLVLYLCFNMAITAFFGEVMSTIYGLINFYKNGGVTKMDAFQLDILGIANNIYEIVNMDKEPMVNGKLCRVILVLDERKYRVQFVDENGEDIAGVRIMNKINLKLHFIRNNESTGYDYGIEEALNQSMKTFEMEQKRRENDDEVELAIKLSLQREEKLDSDWDVAAKGMEPTNMDLVEDSDGDLMYIFNTKGIADAIGHEQLSDACSDVGASMYVD